MKGNNFNKILKLFDYFKIAFQLNLSNKQLYKPQIIFLVVRGLLIISSAFTLLSIGDKMIHLTSMDFNRFISLFWSEFQGIPLILTLVTLLVMILGSTYVESGLYHMFYRAYKDVLTDGDFLTGAGSYFLKFLGGNILIFIFWILALIPYLITGILTLTIGFTLIPILVSTFLLVWKASLVSDDSTLGNAFKKSYQFAKSNFIPTMSFVVFRNAMTSIASGGSGSGSNFSQTSNNANTFFQDMPSDFPIQGAPFSDFFFNYETLKFFVIGITTLITIGTIITGLIQMLFNIFFGLTTIVLYNEGWKQDDLDYMDLPAQDIQDEEVQHGTL
ncbi:hypothetical protein [Petrocella sp. FN5]|uniref:hypothetical protein n=1 Tax=Petrocella sp. FN5 TaxID=3032002 RepID=UPI0023DAEDAF|nr:hypothetical protein [Petrocella sp. FN5]MDF1617146.1 hypothetical protein [Petrocella sp. FN5]